MSPSGRLPHPGAEHVSLMSPAFTAGSLPLGLPGKPRNTRYLALIKKYYVSSGLMTRLHLQELWLDF